MTLELADHLAHFGSKAAWTQCFLHIINLVAKMLIKQFNLPKRRGDTSWQNLDDKLAQLAQLAEDTELEDLKFFKLEDGEGKDDIEGWGNELEYLMADEHTALDKLIKPLHLLLAKVS